ncbi:HEAT repeat domain-containing protein [Fictibacillus sp. NPDC058756]|uniref:HEAT repeat domain-containing protein n=1 Tax=Fictibacillus sp. NPDC058756 TaxID=3346625 RepID=UPI0036B3D3F4
MLKDEILFVAWLAAFLSGVLISMFLYLVVKKVIEINQEKRIQQYMDNIQTAIYNYLYKKKDSRLLIPDSKIKFNAIERLLTHYATVIDGEGKKQIARLADHLFRDRYHKLLSQNKWSTRMNVLYKIDSFKMRALSDVIKRMLKDDRITKEEKLIIFRCLANTNGSEMSLWFEKVPVRFSILEYRSILNRLDEIRFSEVVEAYTRYPENLKLAVIDMIGIQKKLDFVSFLEDQLDHKDFEIRIRSMKAIGEIGFLSDSSVVEHFAFSKRWEERLMATKIIGKTRVPNGLDLLGNLIKDPSWLVRSQAAKAFLSYTEGLERLYDIRFTSDDPFARDMASEWIGRGLEDDFSY